MWEPLPLASVSFHMPSIDCNLIGLAFVPASASLAHSLPLCRSRCGCHARPAGARQEAFTQLLAARDAIGEEVETLPEDYRVKVLGGKWTKSHRGVAFDAYKGEGRPGRPTEFLEEYHMGKSARFDVSLYTVEGAACMARTWCNKCQYFYDLYKESGDRRYVFSAQDILGWESPADFLELAGRLDDPKAKKRVNWLQELAPKA